MLELELTVLNDPVNPKRVGLREDPKLPEESKVP
jgi:hypothetical protein